MLVVKVGNNSEDTLDFTVDKDTSKTMTVQQVVAGSVTSLDITVPNLGTLKAQDFTVKFYDSSGGSTTTVNVSNVGAYRSGKYALTIDSTIVASGDYFIVSIDSANYSISATKGNATV